MFELSKVNEKEKTHSLLFFNFYAMKRSFRANDILFVQTRLFVQSLKRKKVNILKIRKRKEINEDRRG
jgi:hypothetical protein